MNHLIFFLFVLVLSFLFAKLEIEIEGENGWALKLPTWRKKFQSKLLRFIWGQKELTGYHLYLFSFIFTILHAVFLFVPWSLQIESKIIALFILVAILEDFAWFVLNPAFGIKKFQKEFIPWHQLWFVGLPVEYWIYGTLAMVLYFL